MNLYSLFQHKVKKIAAQTGDTSEALDVARRYLELERSSKRAVLTKKEDVSLRQRKRGFSAARQHMPPA